MANKKRKNPFRYLPLDSARAVMSVLTLAFRHKKMHVSGEKYNQKVKGGAIIAMNHTGFSDPFKAATCFMTRRMFFLAA
jgi:1-acyl-sn-glycerol-3-phosphate acyltransferase